MQKVAEYGAYVSLEEYGNKEGLLHRNEISTSWVRNIRDHIREGQKLVLKVLRVDHEKKHIDLSRKRVNKRERIDKIFMFKRERKAESFLRLTAEKLHKPIEEVFESAASPMEEAHGDVYTALEESSRHGVEVLTKINVPPEIAQTLAQIAQERIHPPIVEVKGELHLTSTRPDGVNQIKKALQAAQKSSTAKTSKINIYTIAAPKYSLKVEAENYKEAESLLRKASEAAIKTMTKTGGEGRFQREG